MYFNPDPCLNKWSRETTYLQIPSGGFIRSPLHIVKRKIFLNENVHSSIPITIVTLNLYFDFFSKIFCSKGLKAQLLRTRHRFLSLYF